MEMQSDLIALIFNFYTYKRDPFGFIQNAFTHIDDIQFF